MFSLKRNCRHFSYCNELRAKANDVNDAYTYVNVCDNYPSAQVVRHSPLCNCRPLAQAVQFIRETHCVQVCRHLAHTPASM